jgi:uncharacterized lipoprotein NlpE involved in copper resistance
MMRGNIKKLLCAGMLLTLLFALTGCMYLQGDYTITTDGMITETAKIGFNKSVMESLGTSEAVSSYTVETINGKQYYMTTETQSSTLAELNKSSDSVKASTGVFVANPSSDIEGLTEDYQQQTEDTAMSEMIDYYEVSVKMPEPIVDTNGTLVDEYTAMWEYIPSENKGSVSGRYYAYTQAGKDMLANDTTAPKISGVKSGTWYGDVDSYTSNKKSLPYDKITATDESGMAYVTLNGKSVTDAVADGALKEGKNTITATDLSGNKSTMTIKYDSKAPKVKGVKAGKTYKKSVRAYFKDTGSGIAKVTLNGKSQSLKKSSSRKGFYYIKSSHKGKNKLVVTDKAGNKTSLTFKIAK